MESLDRPADAIAPDGSEVRLLSRGENGSMAHFRLPAGECSTAVRHQTVEELWCFVSGTGEMVIGDEVISVEPGTSVRIAPGVRFQFRSSDDDALEAIGVTMPPWPGDHEAVGAEPFWATSSEGETG